MLQIAHELWDPSGSHTISETLYSKLGISHSSQESCTNKLESRPEDLDQKIGSHRTGDKVEVKIRAPTD